MTPSDSTHEHVDELPVFTGGPSPPPTPEEIAAFEIALHATRARFLATALTEEGMPISAGWCGPEAEPKSPPPANRTESPNLDRIAPPG